MGSGKGRTPFAPTSDGGAKKVNGSKAAAADNSRICAMLSIIHKLSPTPLSFSIPQMMHDAVLPYLRFGTEPRMSRADYLSLIETQTRR
jgi:hypothetical protein